jgi:ADP-ribose pyrophosphatase YjhB (NUDIX family)
MDRRAIEETYEFCPRCAAPNQQLGEIPFRCQACNFACFFGPVAAVGGLVVNDAGLLLFVRRGREPGKGRWGLPGGFVDRDETVEAALKREIAEETGLVVERTVYLTTFPNQYNYGGVVAPVIDLFFICYVRSDQAVEIAADELEHFEWSQPTDELLNNMAFESNRQAILYWLSQRT